MEFEKLPYDTVFHIFEFLSLFEVIRVSSVSKNNWEISKLAGSDKYWKKKYEEFIKNKFQLFKLEKNQRKAHDKMKSFLMKYKVVKIAFILSKKKLHELRDIKIILIGDGTVGKTSLLVRYCQNRFNSKYTPTIFDNKVAKVRYNDQMIGLNLWDVAGEEDYDTLRPLSYQEVDVFVLCFDVSNHTSFINVILKWHKEVKEYVRNGTLGITTDTFRYMLCGMKSDLRDDIELTREMNERNRKFVTPEEAENLRIEIGAYKYIETSAKVRKNVEEMFLACLDSLFLYDAVHEKFNFSKHFLSKKKKNTGGDSKCFVM